MRVSGEGMRDEVMSVEGIEAVAAERTLGTSFHMHRRMEGISRLGFGIRDSCHGFRAKGYRGSDLGPRISVRTWLRVKSLGIRFRDLGRGGVRNEGGSHPYMGT